MNHQEFKLAQKTFDVLEVNRRKINLLDNCDHLKVENFILNSLSEQGISISSSEVKKALSVASDKIQNKNDAHLLKDEKDGLKNESFISLVRNHKILSEIELNTKAELILKKLNKKFLCQFFYPLGLFFALGSLFLFHSFLNATFIIVALALLIVIFTPLCILKLTICLMDNSALDDEVRRAVKAEDSHSQLLSILAKAGNHKSGKIKKSFSFLGWGPKVDLINPQAQQFVDFENEDVKEICQKIASNKDLNEILINWKSTSNPITKLELYWLYSLARQNDF